MIRSSVVLPQPDGPEQRQKLAGGDVELDVVERKYVAEAVRDALGAHARLDGVHATPFVAAPAPEPAGPRPGHARDGGARSTR